MLKPENGLELLDYLRGASAAPPQRGAASSMASSSGFSGVSLRHAAIGSARRARSGPPVELGAVRASPSIQGRIDHPSPPLMNPGWSSALPPESIERGRGRAGRGCELQFPRAQALGVGDGGPLEDGEIDGLALERAVAARTATIGRRAATSMVATSSGTS